MKNLLNNAVNELVVKGMNDLEEVRKGIKVLENKGDKLNLLYEKRNAILNVIDKLEFFKEKAELEFPEEDILEVNIDKVCLILNVQLEDLLDIINEAYVGVIEEEYDEEDEEALLEC